MTEVCHEPLWNNSRSWNNGHPELSNCFEQAVLIGVPNALLWLLIPLQLYSLSRSGRRLGRWTKLTISKMALTGFLIAVEILDLIYTAHALVRYGGNSIPTITIVGPLIQIFTFILVLVYMDLDRRKGRLSNPLLFVYWFLLTISGIVLLRTRFWRSLGFFQPSRIPDAMFRLFVHEVWFPIVLIQLLLSCWADSYPYQYVKKIENLSPEVNASFLNKLCGVWIYDLIRRGSKRHLTNEDIYELIPREHAEHLEVILGRNWTKQFKGRDVMEDAVSVHSGSNQPSILPDQGRGKKPSLVLAVYQLVWTQFWTAALWKFIYDMCIVVVIVLVGAIISFTARPDEYAWRGYVYTLVILMASLLQTFAIVNFNFINSHQGMNTRAALSAMIFRKVLRLSNTSRGSYAVGNITNMLTADMQRITGFFFHQCYLWVTPISVVIMLLVLWAYVGVAALAGLGTVGLLGVAQLFLVNRSRGQEAAAMRYKDIRQRTIGEIFNDIKILKMYAWEHHFAERAIKMRRDEQDALYRASHYSNVNLAITFITPPLAALITYATYLYIDPNNVLNSRTAFVTLLFLFSVRPSLHMMPQAASLFVQAKLAIDRMAAFLLARELDRSAVEHLAPSDLPRPSHSPPPAVCITDGTFSWYPRSHAGQSAALRDITLRVEEGTLLAIVGGVGSGKSSLLAAMLGLMEKVSGHVTIKGTVAYVTQNAWIQNLSLRDNILFGAEFNEGLYQRVVEACSLSKDLEMLTDGDQVHQKLSFSLRPTSDQCLAGKNVFFVD
ncbi:hypothetical protein RvY_00074-1 [Ramazzottius varieornatus]|uniref:ABC transmembrane type-1 domain-containing protein n=1 Tax=Ramazzottius varieornatus TaxID=947166 RepID=A0A1D1UBE8_RAMVA|nr:hypothetical protein RvY_00074-1 [Ramazzottius varieornatus]